MPNSRLKGKNGELQFLKVMRQHLGSVDISRNLDQTRDGGHDVLGLPFAVEIKRYKKITKSDLARFWKQTVEQSDQVNMPPALAYREDNKEWRIRLPMALIYSGCWVVKENDFYAPEWLMDIEYSVDMSPEGFAFLCREFMESPEPGSHLN
jgi:hypothetical protein